VVRFSELPGVMADGRIQPTEKARKAQHLFNVHLYTIYTVDAITMLA
jgi:hypothetical protein